MFIRTVGQHRSNIRVLSKWGMNLEKLNIEWTYVPAKYGAAEPSEFWSEKVHLMIIATSIFRKLKVVRIWCKFSSSVLTAELKYFSLLSDMPANATRQGSGRRSLKNRSVSNKLTAYTIESYSIAVAKACNRD